MSLPAPIGQAGLTEDRPPGGPGSHVHHRLREAILSLRLLPGERLAERALEPLLGASRTPIREALRRLETEGLVVRQGQGYRVAPIDQAELMEVFDYREAVESAAIRLACERATEADIAAIQRVLDSGLGDNSPETWFAIGSDVHVSMARLSGNRFLVRAVEDVVTRIARARWMMATSPDSRGSAHREHSDLLRLIAERRPDAAAAAVIAHGRVVRDKLALALQEGRSGWRAQGIDVI